MKRVSRTQAKVGFAEVVSLNYPQAEHLSRRISPRWFGRQLYLEAD